MNLKISEGNTQSDILADYCTLLKALEKATRIISHQNVAKKKTSLYCVMCSKLHYYRH